MGDSKSNMNLTRGQIFAISAGNIFEWYDFVVYAYVAGELSSAFFPGNHPTANLLGTFAIFAVAYFFRPLGGVIFGSLGDRIGRKRILTLLVLLTGLSSAAIGILPTYGQAGLVAPVLLTLMRIIQGISVGGEYGSAAGYLAESTPPHERGRYISILPQTTFVGLLCASLVLTGLREGLDKASFHEWGWRIPFLLAFPTALVAVWMRSRLDESAEFAKLQEAGELERSPLLSSLRYDWPTILQVIGLMAQYSVGSYVITVYLQTYLSRVGNLDAKAAQWVMSAVLLTTILILPYAGRLADRVGRRPAMLSGLVLLVVFPVPAFHVLSSSGFTLSLVAAIVLAIIFAIYEVAALAAMTEVFKTARRLSGFNVGYNVAISLFAGPTPFVATLLVQVTGLKTAPSYLVVGSAVISFITVLTLKESAPLALERVERRRLKRESQAML
jgi:MFS transporter, MHS family, proline/betaine transporter